MRLGAPGLGPGAASGYCLNHVHEAFQVAFGDSARQVAFHQFEILIEFCGDAASGGRKFDQEAAAVSGAHLSDDQFAVVEPIENAGEGRALMAEFLVNLRDGARSMIGQVDEDMGLSLGDVEAWKTVEV